MFTQTGGVAAALCLYGLFSLGWGYFFLPAATVGAVSHTGFGRRGRKHVKPWVCLIFQAVIAALIILLIYDNTRMDWLLGPFLAAVAVGPGLY